MSLSFNSNCMAIKLNYQNDYMSYMAYIKGIQSCVYALKLNSLLFEASGVGGIDSDAESNFPGLHIQGIIKKK